MIHVSSNKVTVLRTFSYYILLSILDLIGTDKDKDTTQSMLAAEQRSEFKIWVHKRYIIELCPVSLALVALFSLIYSQYTLGYIDINILYRPHRLVLPWNQQTLSGWMGEMTFSIIVVIGYLTANPAFLGLFISFCEYNRAFYEVFHNQFNLIDALVESAAPKHNQKVKKMIIEAIKFHVSVKE